MHTNKYRTERVVSVGIQTACTHSHPPRYTNSIHQSFAIILSITYYISFVTICRRAATSAAAGIAMLQPHRHIARHDVQRLAEVLLHHVQLAARIRAVMLRQIRAESLQMLGRIAPIAGGQFGAVALRQHGGQLFFLQPRRAAVVLVAGVALAAEQIVAEHGRLPVGVRLGVVVRPAQRNNT